MVNEPVRGGFPDPSFAALPGIDRARAYLRGLVPRSPISHLTGYRLTQVGAGTATVTMPTSPWLQNPAGIIDWTPAMEGALHAAVLTGAPPGSEVQLASLSTTNFRASSVASEAIVTRARTMNSGSSFVYGDVLIEDSLGRLVGHATGSALLVPTAVPGEAPVLKPVSAPSYATPDPPARPLPAEVFPFHLWRETDGATVLAMIADGKSGVVPLNELVGLRIVDVSSGAVTATLVIDEWLCHTSRTTASAAILLLAANSLVSAAATVKCAGVRLGVIDGSTSFLRPDVVPGEQLMGRANVTHHADTFVVANVEVTDSHGHVIAVGHETSVLTPELTPSTTGAAPQRILATVLFTDIVSSTVHAERLGDDRWRRLLDEHHSIVRRQLQLFNGREVKTTGDGFLATFDSPGRAVQAARAVRDAVARLGIAVRAGLHTGEYEVSGGDIAGIAVHIASRVQSLAGPGEVLVSGTVRDLVTGSSLRFEDRGRHKLQGLEGEFPIFSVAG